jgi:hypothetical protein
VQRIVALLHVLQKRLSEPPAVAGGFLKARMKGMLLKAEPFIFNSTPFILHPSAFILAFLLNILSGGKAGSPCPLKIVAAQVSRHVYDLAYKIELGHASGLHRP